MWNLTKNSDESEMKNNNPPIAVMTLAIPVVHIDLNHAKQFIRPLITRYRYIG